MIKKFLFPRCAGSRGFSLFLLAMRVLFGILLLSHGLAKLFDFQQMLFSFPDPLGVGSQFSLLLVIFAELCCSVAVIIGLLYRLALIPMIVTMAVAFFAVHQGHLAGGELALSNLIIYLLLFAAGPGRYSADCWIRRSIERKKRFSEEVA